MIAYLSYGDVFDDFAISRVIPNNYFLYVVHFAAIQCHH